jgi:hypothetical protein
MEDRVLEGEELKAEILKAMKEYLAERDAQYKGAS